jgi:adenosylmethionine-8-amino-7-oxononanoate aminotransferase
MDRKKIREADIKNVWHPYTNTDEFEDSDFPVIGRAKGSYFYDVNGKKYLDAIASWWCVNLGHSRPEIIAAVKKQAERLQHVILGGLAHEKEAMLAEKLVEITPEGLNHCFFCGDGASAVEASLRMCLQYWENNGEKKRKKFISLEDGYHGDTLGAVSVGFVEEFHSELKGALNENYAAESPHCALCKYGKKPDSCGIECFESMEKVMAAHHAETAAVIVEPLCQGSAGMRIYPLEYLKRLRKLCDRYGLLLIADEIAVGFGRTGEMFACEKAGIVPDIMTLGKGMTAGYLPMSASVVTDKIYDSFRNGKTFFYGHTFSGNPITAAAALEAVELYKKLDIIEKIKPLSKILRDEMASAAGLLGGCFFNSLGMIAMMHIPEKEGGAKRAKLAAQKAREAGVFLRPLGPVLYVWPPLTVSENELREIFRVLKKALLAARE